MNKDIIESFYQAFQKRDADGMAACYHPQVVFSDPAFGQLQGEDARLMWKMLCESGRDLQIEYSSISINNDTGKARWEAFYTFSKTGRKVHNIIDAQFEFKDGKIIKHTDNFNLYRWARQALGLQGWLLGGTSFFKSSLQKQTRRALERYKAKLEK